ncbi:MAG TPA: mannonate dehydratase [Bryobacteraceae bacterium]|nr:mannonate dehydratase [Bryobacteraceae bacterium]
MKIQLSRRRMMETAGLAAFLPRVEGAAKTAEKEWPLVEGPDTPKLCIPGGRDEAGMRRVKQIGVDHVIGGMGRIPWKEEDIRAEMERFKAGGLNLYNIMIAGFDNAIYARAGRDEDIEKVKESIVAAGKAGLPVVEYNWYAHRFMEGYHDEIGRAGAGYTAMDYDREVDGQPADKLGPLPNEGAHTLEEMWANISYFLKAVVPVAEKAGVRLALHPNDPPVPLSRGSQQIMGTVAGWKHLIDIVNSPSNGITFDCGVTREMGENPVEVARYFASRKRINHVHFRNVVVRKPYEHYTEVFIDAGQVNMFGVMKELVKNKYNGSIYPEHPRALDYDRERGPIRGYPGGGGYTGDVYDVAYARAMLQAALESV